MIKIIIQFLSLTLKFFRIHLCLPLVDKRKKPDGRENVESNWNDQQWNSENEHENSFECNIKICEAHPIRHEFQVFCFSPHNQQNAAHQTGDVVNQKRNKDKFYICKCKKLELNLIWDIQTNRIHLPNIFPRYFQSGFGTLDNRKFRHCK
jgi:hypothetical protein